MAPLRPGRAKQLFYDSRHALYHMHNLNLKSHSHTGCEQQASPSIIMGTGGGENGAWAPSQPSDPRALDLHLPLSSSLVHGIACMGGESDRVRGVRMAWHGMARLGAEQRSVSTKGGRPSTALLA